MKQGSVAGEGKVTERHGVALLLLITLLIVTWENLFILFYRSNMSIQLAEIMLSLYRLYLHKRKAVVWLARQLITIHSLYLLQTMTIQLFFVFIFCFKRLHNVFFSLNKLLLPFYEAKFIQKKLQKQNYLFIIYWSSHWSVFILGIHLFYFHKSAPCCSTSQSYSIRTCTLGSVTLLWTALSFYRKWIKSTFKELPCCNKAIYQLVLNFYKSVPFALKTQCVP